MTLFKYLSDHVRSQAGDEAEEEELKTYSTIGCYVLEGCPIPLPYWNSVFSSLSVIKRDKDAEETTLLYQACRDGYPWGEAAEVLRLIDAYVATGVMSSRHTTLCLFGHAKIQGGGTEMLHIACPHYKCKVVKEEWERFLASLSTREAG